jgi:chromosome segregation ATPase
MGERAMTQIGELVKHLDEVREMERKCREVLADHVRILERHLMETRNALEEKCEELVEERARKHNELANLRLELAEERRRRRELDPACRDLDGFMDAGDETR